MKQKPIHKEDEQGRRMRGASSYFGKENETNKISRNNDQLLVDNNSPSLKNRLSRSLTK